MLERISTCAEVSERTMKLRQLKHRQAQLSRFNRWIASVSEGVLLSAFRPWRQAVSSLEDLK